MTQCSTENINAFYEAQKLAEKQSANIILSKEDFYESFLYNSFHLNPIQSNGRHSVKTKTNDGIPIIIFIKK